MKLLLGFLLAFAIGFGCRLFGIPAPAPPVLVGALLVVAMTLGWLAVDRHASTRARSEPHCAGPSGRTAAGDPP